LPPELDTNIYDVISKLFKFLAKVNILIPGEFKSSKGDEAIKCSVKASDGFLYPLKSSLIFINKPITYIKLSEIKYVEFSRIGSSGMPSSRSFDLTVARLTDNSSITFAGIDKDEYKNLSAYLKDKGIKMRSVDVETNQHIEMSDDDGAEDEEESEQPRKGSKKGGAPGGGKKPQAAAAMDDDDSDEDDESFNEEGSGGSEDEEDDDDEEGEAEKDDDSDGDAHMDEGIDKDELKALQKENAGIDLSGSRRTRGGARVAA
jgi:structure-specific recognition protein 1